MAFIEIQNHHSIPALAEYGEAFLSTGTYPNGRIALQIGIVGNYGPELYGTLSTNLPDSPTPGEGWFYVKDWNENHGLAEGLAGVGLIELKNLPQPIRTGYVQVTRKARVVPNVQA